MQCVVMASAQPLTHPSILFLVILLWNVRMRCYMCVRVRINSSIGCCYWVRPARSFFFYLSIYLFIFVFLWVLFFFRVFLVHSLCKIVLFGTYCKKTFIFVSFCEHADPPPTCTCAKTSPRIYKMLTVLMTLTWLNEANDVTWLLGLL